MRMDKIKVRGFTGPWYITRLGYLPPHGSGAPK
jgi:hypothetical protein